MPSSRKLGGITILCGLLTLQPAEANPLLANIFRVWLVSNHQGRQRAFVRIHICRYWVRMIVRSVDEHSAPDKLLFNSALSGRGSARSGITPFPRPGAIRDYT